MPRVRLAPWQFVALHNPYEHFAFWGGVATGKTFTGSHFCIQMLAEFPHLTGFIGANTYDQLTQATLRELFIWLDAYGYDYVIDQMPPPEWKEKKRFKKYSNILTVRNPLTGRCTTIFTRILSKGNPIRGIQFSWYWLDETRDTPENTHDVVISRMRESPIRRGLVTSTTNGEDWSHKRFYVNARKGQRLYGSMHIPTIESVRAGIISQEYFDGMRQTYSPVMVDQELNALHVNALGGRAYYAAGSYNALELAPWGDRYPDPSRPLIVGCDFNFSPAPCVWMVGQVGPNRPVNPSHPEGLYFDECIHWFREISGVETSTPAMMSMLLGQFPDFDFFEVYGDASGGVGTTSNAGETDFNQMAHAFQDAEVAYTIDFEQRNPLVRDRVENMNSLFLNGLGQVRQTYSEVGCPLMHDDARNVGWKNKTTLTGKGKLDDRGIKTRTHATDGAGYATFKKFPPKRRGEIITGIQSGIRSEYGLVQG